MLYVAVVEAPVHRSGVLLQLDAPVICHLLRAEPQLRLSLQATR